MVVFSHLFSTFSLLSSFSFSSFFFHFFSYAKKKRKVILEKRGRDDNTRLLVHNADTSRLLRVLPLVFAYSETTVFTVPKGKNASLLLLFGSLRDPRRFTGAFFFLTAFFTEKHNNNKDASIEHAREAITTAKKNHDDIAFLISVLC